MSKPQAHIRIDFPDGVSIGPGKITLLEWIERSGSLSAAGRALGMSYRRAWLLLHSVNDSFVEPSVEFTVGGKEGGGAQLTDFGRKLIASYRAFETSVDALAARSFGTLKPARAAVAEDGKRRRSVSRPLGRKR
ncbi:MAG: winged helix-turn-helix domain-containing protein [Steroidobacteraceae bacterium]